MSGRSLAICANRLAGVFRPNFLNKVRLMETPCSKLVCSSLRKFSSSNAETTQKSRIFSLTPPKGVSPTPISAMKLLGNTLVAARNAPGDWDWAVFKSNIITSEGGWFVGHTQVVTSLDFCSDRLVSASKDGTCKVWDLNTTKTLKTLNHGNTSVNCMQVEGITMVCGTSDTTGSIWNLKTYERENVLSGHIAPINCIAIEDDLVATGSADTTCRIWNARTGKCKRVLKEHTKEISCLQLSDGTLVTGSFDKSCKKWDPTSDVSLKTFKHDAEVIALEFEGNTLAVTTSDRTCTIWDLRDDSKPIRILKGHTDTITCMRLQGDILVTGSEDHSVRLWNLKTGDSKVIETFFCEVTRLVLRGDLLIVGLEYGSIFQIDLSKKK